jgi:hypothetical protein
MITFLLSIIAVIQLAAHGGKWLAAMLMFIVIGYGGYQAHLALTNNDGVIQFHIQG